MKKDQVEIERKYLVKEIPNLEGAISENIEQGYIHFEPETRIRKKGDLYLITQKGNGNLARKELEGPIDFAVYHILSSLIQGNVIKKERLCVPLSSGHIAELDIYEGELSGLMTVEVEFSCMEDVKTFEAPFWFGEEVTEDSRYKNKNLARATHEELVQILPVKEKEKIYKK